MMFDQFALHNSKTPKYKQLVREIERLVQGGKLKVGDRIPSINEVAETYLLSRDTVEKAYKQLKENNIINAVRGKGYYISNTNVESKLQVCLMFNKLSPYKKIIYDGLVSNLGDQVVVDLFIHHCNPDLFENLIRKTNRLYSYYVIMPHLEGEEGRIIDLLMNIPEGKLILLDKDITNIKHKNYGLVCQDFERDLFEMINTLIDRIKSYNRIFLVFPTDTAYPYPQEIVRGFKRACGSNNLPFEVLNEIVDSTQVKKGDLYIVISDMDLANLIKQARTKKLIIGEELGILSYNDTPLKEVLAKGISVISTDFEHMAVKTSEMITENRLTKIRNPFRFIKRQSF